MFAYEKLDVYRKALEANKHVYRMLKANKTTPLYAKNQLGRAALSVMLNIAEGTAKFSKKDRRKYYITARGSAFECGALLAFLSEEGEITMKQKDELIGLYEEVSRILYTMIQNLSKE